MPPYWRPAATAALALAAIVVLVAGAAHTADFRDDFASFDSRQWVSISRPFGHGAVDPTNVAVANETLGVRLPGGRLDGGELRTTSCTGTAPIAPG